MWALVLYVVTGPKCGLATELALVIGLERNKSRSLGEEAYEKQRGRRIGRPLAVSENQYGS